MPSGSHGGSAGSHGGGGSSFGGGHHHSGGVSSSNPTPICYYRHGVRYYVPVSQSNSIRTKIVCLFILFIFVFCLSIVVGQLCNDINKIKVDRAYYIDMIENAEQDEDYCKTGKITDIFYNSSCDRWYFTYVIPYKDEDDDEELLEGYTFSVYDNTQIKKFKIGDKIDFAVNNKDVDKNTDSINLGYKELPLEADGEYLVERQSLIIISIFLGAIVIGIVLIIAWLVGTIKKQSKVAVGTENLNIEEKKNACKYCGTIFNDGENRCSGCGARKQE